MVGTAVGDHGERMKSEVDTTRRLTGLGGCEVNSVIHSAYQSPEVVCLRVTLFTAPCSWVLWTLTQPSLGILMRVRSRQHPWQSAVWAGCGDGT